MFGDKNLIKEILFFDNSEFDVLMNQIAIDDTLRSLSPNKSRTEYVIREFITYIGRFFKMKGGVHRGLKDLGEPLIHQNKKYR